jgi:hypothetical protein
MRIGLLCYTTDPFPRWSFEVTFEKESFWIGHTDYNQAQFLRIKWIKEFGELLQS